MASVEKTRFRTETDSFGNLWIVGDEKPKVGEVISHSLAIAVDDYCYYAVWHSRGEIHVFGQSIKSLRDGIQERYPKDAGDFIVGPAPRTMRAIGDSLSADLKAAAKSNAAVAARTKSPRRRD